MIEPGTPIRFTGGIYNGFNGVVAKICDQFCSVNVTIGAVTSEVVEDVKFVAVSESTVPAVLS